MIHETDPLSGKSFLALFWPVHGGVVSVQARENVQAKKVVQAKESVQAKTGQQGIISLGSVALALSGPL